MVTNLKPTGRASSVPGGLAIGAGVNMVVTGMSSIILGKLLQTEALEWKDIGYGVMVLLLVASFLGAAIAAARIKRQRLMVCALSGLIYFGILLSITALFFGGQYEAVGVTAALILAGSWAAGLLGMRENRGGVRRKKGRRYR